MAEAGSAAGCDQGDTRLTRVDECVLIQAWEARSRV